jgi:L-fuculose-phosphate aldolase
LKANLTHVSFSPVERERVPPAERDLPGQRKRLAAAARKLSAAGLVIGTAGNISERAGELVAVTPTGAAFETLEPDEVVVVDLDGSPVAGRLEPTSELQLHLGVYERFDAGAVVHTHAPMATALSCVLDELPCVHYQMLALGGSVRVAPYRTFGTRELADATLDALRSRTAALMSNHGAINYGTDLDSAVDSALLLEWACTIYWRAAAIGEPRSLDGAQQEAFVAAVIERGYGTIRPVDRER